MTSLKILNELSEMPLGGADCWIFGSCSESLIEIPIVTSGCIVVWRNYFMFKAILAAKRSTVVVSIDVVGGWFVDSVDALVDVS